MSIFLVMNFKGATQNNYDNVCETLDFPAQIPDGLILHGAGPTPDGWCVIDCWESKAQFDRFFETKLGSALAKEGVPQPDLQTVETYRTVAGKALAGARF